MRRVAVTGMGVLSPLGCTLAEVYGNAAGGCSGIRRLEVPFAQRLNAPLAATVAFDGATHFEPPRLRMLDRSSQFALVAARQAFTDAHCVWDLIDRSRVGTFVGTGMGGSQSNDDGYQTLYGEDSDRIKPFTVLMGMHNASAAWIAIEYQLSGPSLTYSTACSSSAVAIGEAWLRVASGSLDMAIAGGAEAPLSFGSLKAWEALHTLAAIDAHDPSASCKPFSKKPQRHGAGRRRRHAGARILGQRRGARCHDSRRSVGVWVDHGHRPHHPTQRGGTGGSDAGSTAIGIP